MNLHAREPEVPGVARDLGGVSGGHFTQEAFVPTATVPNTRHTNSSVYRRLAQQARTAGLLHPRRWYYAAKIVTAAAALAAGVVALLVLGDSPVALAVAAVWAVASTQVVFLGHDAGHLQNVPFSFCAWRARATFRAHPVHPGADAVTGQGPRPAAGPGTSAPLPTPSRDGSGRNRHAAGRVERSHKHPRRRGYVLSGSYSNERSKRTR